MYLLIIHIGDRLLLKAIDAETISVYKTLEEVTNVLIPEDTGSSVDCAVSMHKAMILAAVFNPIAINFNGSMDEINYFLEPAFEGNEDLIIQIRGEITIDGAYISEEFIKGKEVIELRNVIIEKIRSIALKHSQDLRVEAILGSNLIKDLTKPTLKERVNNIINQLWKWLKTH